MLYRPDETTVAIVDRVTHGRRPIHSADDIESAAKAFADPESTVMLVQLRGHADGPVMQRLRSWGLHVSRPPSSSPEIKEIATRLGLRAEYIYEVPMGRRYALLTR